MDMQSVSKNHQYKKRKEKNHWWLNPWLVGQLKAHDKEPIKHIYSTHKLWETTRVIAPISYDITAKIFGGTTQRKKKTMDGTYVLITRFLNASG